MDDNESMKRALMLAERGRGYVEPNPLVGAVLVRDGFVVGEGWHEKFGEAHAEINALNQAQKAARGATLHLTLEPCCHHGKTPPCSDALIRAGIRRVIAAMTDPFAKVNGQGFKKLQEAGIDVQVGLCETEARRLNAPYLKLHETGRPYVHAKWAMTLDGKIATRSGDSKWISGEASRRRVHQLRGRMDAIIVGIGTVLADDPLLTARPPGPRTAARIVLDSHGRTPLDSQLVGTARQYPTIVATESIASEKKGPLAAAGCEVLQLADVGALLDELGRRQMTNILVEGGSTILGSFLDARAIDEFHVYVAPILAGGKEAVSPTAGAGVEKIADALQLPHWELEMIGKDVYIHGYCNW